MNITPDRYSPRSSTSCPERPECSSRFGSTTAAAANSRCGRLRTSTAWIPAVVIAELNSMDPGPAPTGFR
jgi:hypothetical protein